MNFTREPIIETVITPREGCKLVVRSSKANGQEDYYVDAVEVVSFGHSFFFRSSERPKSFLVPVSDYEILELRETRMVLKNVSTDRSLKIGGGRDAPLRPQREQTHEERAPREESPEAQPQEATSDRGQERNGHNDRKRDRRRRGRRGGRDRDPQHRPHPPADAGAAPTPEEGPELNEETPASPPEELKAPSFISKLFPPPSTLIKETLGRYKTTESVEEEAFTESNDEEAEESDDFDQMKPTDDENNEKDNKLEE